MQGYTGIGDTFAATPMHAWDTMYEIRDTYAWQRGRHGIKFGGDYHWYTWPMWGFFQNRGYYQFTNGYTTQFGFNDGSGSALASMLLSLPAVKQRQAGIPQMNLRIGEAARSSKTAGKSRQRPRSISAFATNTRIRSTTSRTPTPISSFTMECLRFLSADRMAIPHGLMYANKHNFAPRIGIAKNIPHSASFFTRRYGIFYHAG